MTDLKNISKRLQVIASFIPKGSFFADIGSDHAYLPCYVCKRDSEAKAIAGEVNKGPFDRATNVVEQNNLSDVIDVRLGDGLEVLNEDLVDSLVIAGMGGTLITSILEQGKQSLQHIDCLILQPNIGESFVRRWLLDNGYHLINEKIIYENSHYYEVLVANQKAEDTIYQQKNLSKELFFGPFLLKERSDVFLNKYQELYHKTKWLIDNMQKAKHPNEARLAQFNQELNWMKEVLKLNE